MTQERVGFRWTDEEDTELLKNLNQNLDYETIAAEHHRTVNGVKTRLTEIYFKKIQNQELSMDEASTILKIPKGVLESFKRKYEKKLVSIERRKHSTTASAPASLSVTKRVSVPKLATAPKYGAVPPINPQYMAILTEIRDYLKILADKN